ncbi:helix-hairpin-helix domain-containing protein [Vibrio parahaemolyticus]|nr:helix-hairpin-helix domain-containing protein [Vibrio parahaemolyticus]EIZ1340204.1 helix-hairpin-helix domain-containing protein [Vibrio parahaemolyticus]
MDKRKTESLALIEQSLHELESQKGSLLAAIQKLQRAASLISNEDVVIWCKIQLGDQVYTKDLADFIELLVERSQSPSEELDAKVLSFQQRLTELGMNSNLHWSNEELNVKRVVSGGGYSSIGFVQEKYADLVKTKSGNDGTYYKTNLQEHIAYVTRKAHAIASELHEEIKFSGTISNAFELLKFEIDDQLLDLSPELAEQLMLAFKSVSSKNPEEWSQALTTCRRLLEGLADELFPVSDVSVNGRTFKQGQYVNRLWAFMDKSIESNSNKELAKSHVDFVGSWLEKVNKLANKGVHAELEQIEAVKAVFHTYMVVGDLLGYLTCDSSTVSQKTNINDATIDELEALLGISRNVAKEIFKYRVKEGALTENSLLAIPGVGKKTVAKAKEEFEVE